MSIGSNSITLTNKLSEDQPTKTWELVFDESDHESQELKEKFLVHMFQHAADHRYILKTPYKNLRCI